MTERRRRGGLSTLLGGITRIRATDAGCRASTSTRSSTTRSSRTRLLPSSSTRTAPSLPARYALEPDSLAQMTQSGAGRHRRLPHVPRELHASIVRWWGRVPEHPAEQDRGLWCARGAVLPARGGDLQVEPGHGAPRHAVEQVLGEYAQPESVDFGVCASFAISTVVEEV